MLKSTYRNFHKRFHHWLYGNCAVLLYHRVSNYSTDPQMLCVSPQNFNSHIDLLNQKYNLISIDELLKYFQSGKKIPRKSIAITFDDGYADNYLEALPILEKHNTQALFYIATGTLNTNKEFWWDAVERIILISNEKTNLETFQLRNKTYSLNTKNKTEKHILYESLLPEFRLMNPIEREEKINELSFIFNATKDRESHRALTFDELKLMSKSSSAIIGAHTHMHPSLAALDSKNQFHEIITSKNILEELLNKDIIHFSYPFGGSSNFNEETVNICKKLNFQMVAANFPAMSNKYSNKFYFPRFLVRDWDSIEFENKLNQFFAQ